MTGWVKERDCERHVKAMVVRALDELAVEFASTDRVWTSEEIVAVIGQRKRFRDPDAYDAIPGYRLPDDALKLYYSNRE